MLCLEFHGDLQTGWWIVDGLEVRVDPVPLPPVPFEGARVHRERIVNQEINDGERPPAHSDRRRSRIEASLKATPQGAERLERRSDVKNESLARELERIEKWNGVDEQKASASASQHEERNTISTRSRRQKNYDAIFTNNSRVRSKHQEKNFE